MADDHSDVDPTEDTDTVEDAPEDAADVDTAEDESTATTDSDAGKATKTRKEDDADGKDEAPVVRKKVVSKRVTPKGGARAASSSTSTASKPSSGATRSKRRDDDDDVSFSSGRYTPPGTGSKAQLPSPWWVPAMMFAFLILGALLIMLNYMEVFGDAENVRLIIGLALILAGIVTATQYR